MGFSILDLVIQRLRQANFIADVAFPGQKVPKLTGTVAAVHIEKVDRANLTVTVEIDILAPASMGGTACELEALRATEVLRWTGAVCVQNGCSYDGVAQVYSVRILATFTGVTEAADCTIWQGFYCYIGEYIQKYAISFTEERVSEAEPEYVMGEAAPTGIRMGSSVHKIRLEELIPCGSPEAEEPEGAFEMRIITDRKTEVYSGCRWSEVTREFTKQGLRRIRSGLALGKTEE